MTLKGGWTLRDDIKEDNELAIVLFLFPIFWDFCVVMPGNYIALTRDREKWLSLSYSNVVTFVES